jgi:hypothetical protein
VWSATRKALIPKEKTVAEGLLLEFTGVGKTEYDAVHAKLGIDPDAGTGDYPDGLLMHTAAITGAGTLAVAEVWRSRADQEAFLADRLGSALASAGVTSAPTVRWISLLSFQVPAAS